MEKKLIGELLVEEGYVTAEQVNEALRVQKTTPERICNILMDLGYLTEGQFLEFLSTVPGTASIELSRCELDREVLDLIPGELATKLELVPIGRMRNLLTVAMVCPLDEAGRNELEETTSLKVKPVLCSRGAVQKALARYYREDEPEISPEADADVLALEASLKLTSAARLVEQIEDLPTLPAIVSAITAAANDPASSAADIGNLISTDGALSAKLLKLANSPAFGFSRKVSDINQAVALLGFNEIQALAMSVSVYGYLIEKADFDFKSYWNHSLRCATLARLTSANLKKLRIESAFVAGLLHDVGKVILAMSMRGKQGRVELIHRSEKIPIWQAEDNVLGINHAEVGYQLAEHWLFPAIIAQAIRFHHSPESEPERSGLAGIVFLANSFSKIDAAGLEEAVFDERTHEVLQSLGMPENGLRKSLQLFGETASDFTVF